MRTIKLIICTIIFLGLFNFSSAQIQDNNKKGEYLILRVSHHLKRSGFEDRMTIDIGEFKNHSLKNIVENGENGVIIFNLPDVIVVAKNEVDCLSMLLSLGFKIVSLNKVTISGKEYFQYLLYKNAD